MEASSATLTTALSKSTAISEILDALQARLEAHRAAGRLLNDVAQLERGDRLEGFPDSPALLIQEGVATPQDRNLGSAMRTKYEMPVYLVAQAYDVASPREGNDLVRRLASDAGTAAFLDPATGLPAPVLSVGGREYQIWEGPFDPPGQFKHQNRNVYQARSAVICSFRTSF